MESSFTIKEFLEGTVVPRIERLQIQVDKLDMMAREGSPFGQREVNRVEKELQDMKEDIEEIRQALLTPENISTLIGKSLEKTEARGWTHRERLMSIGLFVMSFITLMTTVYSLRQK